MTANTAKPHRRRNFTPVRTIDLFNQPKPIAFADQSYVKSKLSPLQDPCAYAASLATQPSGAKPANRIEIPLMATYEETQNGKPNERSTSGDPAFLLSEQHNIDAYVDSMTIAGVSVNQYRAKQPSRFDTSLSSGNVSVSSLEPHLTMATPIRRPFDGPQGSTAKRQRTSLASAASEGDVSMDTAMSVLRMIDESLVGVGEVADISTPRVAKASPGPSPRQLGPTYAYNSRSKLVEFGGLPPRPTTGTLFSLPPL